MDRKTFSQRRDEHYRRIAEIGDKKGADYAGDEDALANFKLAAEQLGVSPLTIWAVYAHKHWSAVMSFVKNGGQVESEPIEGRLHDVIFYCFLLLGLIEDGKTDGVPPEPPPGPPATEGYRLCTGGGTHAQAVVPLGQACRLCLFGAES